MKNKLWSILFGIGVLAFIFSGCQKQNQLDPASDNSTKVSVSANEGIGHTFDATFTKYVNNYPYMTGVVGGDVGTGTYAGEVLSLTTEGNITTIVALYHFNGRVHSFTAHVIVTMNNTLGTAEITGRVTEGWLKDASVIGEFNVMGICPISTPGNQEGTQCYQGILHIAVPK